MKAIITSVIDFFYPLFRKIMPLQTFRYAACGGSNALFGLIIYFFTYWYFFKGAIVDIGFFAFEPHSAALFLSSIITFLAGFTLNRYVVFTTSKLKGRIQLFRYFLSFGSNLVINYALLKLMVEKFFWNPVFSQLFTICIVLILSYFTQRRFTFKVHKDGHTEFTDLQ